MAAEPALHPPLTGAPHRPGWRFLLAHPAHVLALGFGSGLAPVAPGTFGTVWAWIVYAAWPPAWGDGWTAAGLAAAVLLGCWVCTITARHMAQADPSVVVWDEIVAFWIVLWLVTPASFAEQAAAFVLFRFFDAAKPGPVAWADQRFKLRRGQRIGWAQGFGIVFDDLVAALCTLLVIALWKFVR